MRSVIWVQWDGVVDIWQRRMWQYGTTSGPGHCQKDLERQPKHQLLTRVTVHLISERQHTSNIFFSQLSPPVVPIMVFPVSPAHRMWQSAYSGGFFAPTNFLGQSSAERRTNVYVLTFTAPVDGRTGRMGETLCPVPPIFSFSQVCHPVVFEIDNRLFAKHVYL